MVELLYRERFSLSHQQMQDEPADAVEWWVEVESARQKAQNTSDKPGSKPAMGERLDPDDM